MRSQIQSEPEKDELCSWPEDQSPRNALIIKQKFQFVVRLCAICRLTFLGDAKNLFQ
jgi:hypothetical protein